MLPHKRPSTEKVKAAIAAAGRLDVWEWMPTCVSLAAFCAPRLAEQLGFRAIDVNLDDRTLDMNGVWKVVHTADVPGDRRDRFRAPHPKNKLRRTAPYLGSQQGDLMARCTAALDLPVDATQADVVSAIEVERARRADLAKGNWRDFKEDPRLEPWLFVDASGVPPTKEAFKEAWHRVRDEVEWSAHIPYKNLPHHAVLWRHGQAFEWPTIAEWDGHDVRTLQAYYVLAAEDATVKARPTLDSW